MPYCPKCGGEYREGFRECSDCLLELVDTPPKTPRPPGLDDEDGKPDKKKEGKKPSAIDNTLSCAACRPKVNLVMVFKAQNDMEAIEVKSMLAGSNISAIAAESGGRPGMEVPVFVDENDAADARELIRTSYGKAVEDGEDETVIYEMEEGEDLTVEEDEEEDEEEEEDDVVEEQYASTMEEKSEELRRRMGGTDSNRGLLIVLIVVVIIVLIVLYLHYG